MDDSVDDSEGKGPEIVHADSKSSREIRAMPRNHVLRPIRCGRCGGTDLTLYWQELADGRRAIRADCGRCQRFVAFLPQTPANVAAADAAVSPTGLLDV